MRYLVLTLLSCMIALCLIDTGLFAYPSLSLYFSATLFSFLLLAAISLYVLIKKKNTGCSPSLLLMLLWTAYIAVHTFFLVPHGEHYRLFLMLGYGCFFLALFILFKQEVVTRQAVIYIFLGGGVLQAVWCFLQYSGLTGTENRFFEITGSLYNPNITAMYVTVLLPFCLFYLLPQKRCLAISLCGMLVLSLWLLECRTAFIGVAVVLAVYLFSKEKIRKYVVAISPVYKSLAVLLLIAGTLFAGHYLYHYKKDSADGRVFIWRVSAGMIVQKPVTGYGYGLFERNYNLHQAGYFKSNKGSDTEKKNAAHVFMAYNEYIEQAAEGGITGLLFYITFLGFLLFIAVKQRDWEAASVVLVVIVMGSVNFVIQAIPLWLVLLAYGASLSAKEKAVIGNKQLGYIAPGIALLLSGFLLSNQLGRSDAQYHLKQAIELNKSGKRKEAVNMLEQYADKAGTSEAYLRTYGKAIAANQGCDKALEVFEKVAYYTSVTDVFFSKVNCYLQLGEYGQAQQELSTVANMIPTNLKSRYLLMQLYRRTGEREKARRMAQEITAITPKVDSKESRSYKKAAREVLGQQ